MKTRCFLGICCVLVVVAGCSKKSDSPPEESVVQVVDSEQPQSKQTAPDTPPQPTLEPGSVKAGAEKAPSDETEYFAIYLEG